MQKDHVYVDESLSSSCKSDFFRECESLQNSSVMAGANSLFCHFYESLQNLTILYIIVYY